jgi:hypothetical protein
VLILPWGGLLFIQQNYTLPEAPSLDNKEQGIKLIDRNKEREEESLQ